MSILKTVQVDIRPKAAATAPVLPLPLIIVPWGTLAIMVAGFSLWWWLGKLDEGEQENLSKKKTAVATLVGECRDFEKQIAVINVRKDAAVLRSEWLGQSVQSHGLFAQAFNVLASKIPQTDGPEGMKSPVARLSLLDMKVDREGRWEIFVSGVGDEDAGKAFAGGLEVYLTDLRFTSQQLRNTEPASGWGFRGFFNPPADLAR